VVAAGAVHLVDHGGESGGLAGVDGTGDEDEAVVESEEPAENLEVGIAEGVECASLRRHDAVGAGHAPFVDRDAGAEALAVAEGERELEVGGVLEFLELFFVEQREVGGLGDIGRERLLGEVVDLPVLADEGAGLGAEVEIAHAGGLAIGEEPGHRGADLGVVERGVGEEGVGGEDEKIGGHGENAGARDEER
jgi:hypothetical protein